MKALAAVGWALFALTYYGWATSPGPHDGALHLGCFSNGQMRFGPGWVEIDRGVSLDVFTLEAARCPDNSDRRL